MSRTISPSLLLRPAFPAQALITQGRAANGASVFQAHAPWHLSNDRKTPCDTLSVGQADAGRIKAAKKEPHRLPDVVTFTDGIDFYL